LITFNYEARTEGPFQFSYYLDWFVETSISSNIEQVAVRPSTWVSILPLDTGGGTGTGGGATVPEPATFILLGSGLAGLAFYRRKKK